MVLAVSSSTNSFVQFMTVLIIFVVVLVVTYLVTRWIAGYQKGHRAGNNIEVVEVARLADKKYVHIIRVGQKYLAVATGKDTVTMLAEIPEEDLFIPEEKPAETLKFRELLDKMQHKDFGGEDDGSTGNS